MTVHLFTLSILFKNLEISKAIVCLFLKIYCDIEQLDKVYCLQGPPILFLMMRLNFKIVLLLLSVVMMLVVLSLWSRCGDAPGSRSWLRRYHGGFYGGQANGAGDAQAEEIDCEINDEYNIGCRKEGNEVGTHTFAI